MVILDKRIQFPPVDTADEDGVVAIGGDLGTDRLLLAYRSGIFPWYNDNEPIMWWSPDPRCVLLPHHLKISKSMQTVLNNGRFRFTSNRAFVDVIENCKLVNTQKHNGTWISDDIINAYTKLHTLGYAHSAEAWRDGELVGGLYGIRMGNVFFGESMFSKVSNASKFAFILYVQQLQKEGVVLIDCQQATEHLHSLGATLIKRSDFIKALDIHC